MLNQAQKNELVQCIRIQRAIDFPNIPEAKSCLYSSLVVFRELSNLGYRPVLQCGSIYWPAVSPEHDDGEMPTHYSMVWSPNDIKSIISVSLGNLPEMHCWIGLVETQEIIDLNVKFFPMAWKENIGYDWTTKLPPDYIWMNIESCQKEYGVIYEVNESATKFGTQQMIRIIKQRK